MCPIIRSDDGLGHRYLDVHKNTVTKYFPDEYSFEKELYFWRLASDNEIAPKILHTKKYQDGIKLPDSKILWVAGVEVERMTKLSEFVDSRDVNKKRLAKILTLKLQWLHELNVAHRDLHAHNVIVNDAHEPFLIDWEFAIKAESDVSYDLYGSKASGISPPQAHQQRKDGIWWSCENVLSIERYLGSPIICSRD